LSRKGSYIGGHTVLTQRRGDLEATLARDKARHMARRIPRAGSKHPESLADYNRIAAGLHDSGRERYELEKAALENAMKKSKDGEQK
jgi:hypothetical protein